MLNTDHAYRFIAHVDLADFGLFIVAVFMTAAVVKAIRSLSEWIVGKFPKKRMAVFEWVPLLNFLIYFVGIVGAFYIIFDPSQDLIIAFIISSFVATGFAAKEILASILSGIVLLVDKPFQVGDRITFQEYYGDILMIGLRSVKLLTLDESVVTIPNSRFLNDAVSSSSAGEVGMMTTVDVYVSPEADLYKSRDILHEETQKSTYVNGKQKVIIVGKEILGDNGIVSFMLTVKCILKDARREKAFQTDLLLEVNRAFKKAKIKLPAYG